MKKIHLLVVQAFIRPFIVTFFIVMFVLLMLFLFKYIDDLIGKGFEWYVILQLLWYASATNVAMALPLAMLLSSIMTFGSLGENYELVAIKSAGISLQRAMMPLIILVTILSILALLFSNYIMPIANLKMGSLLYDVRNQKASPTIQEGIFVNGFEGYTVRVGSKDKDGQTLRDVLIYQDTTNVPTLMAKEGKMYVQGDYLILKLKDGVRYEEQPGANSYNPRQRFTRYRFKATEQKFKLPTFQRTDEDLFKTNYAMLNLKQLKHYQDSFSRQADSNLRTIISVVRPSFRMFSYPFAKVKGSPDKKWASGGALIEKIPLNRKMDVINNAISGARNVTDQLTSKLSSVDVDAERIRRFIIEYHRKFTLAMSCLLLFSIGAPLGAIIRKGGLGLPVVMSIIFFLIYHIISTISEKSAKEGSVDPILGMWLAILVLSPLGAFLTYKATVDSALFNLDSYKMYFAKLFRKLSKQKV